MGRKLLDNGDILLASEAQGFEVMITCDQNLRYQQNLRAASFQLLKSPPINGRR
jgi:hypothetical protein